MTGDIEVLHQSRANDLWVLWDFRRGLIDGICRGGVWVSWVENGHYTKVLSLELACLGHSRL